MMKNPCIQFMFAYQEQDLDRMMSFCDTNGEVWFKPLGEDGRGKIGELGRGIWSALIDCFPDLTNTVDSAMIDEDNRVRADVVISGTQAKDFADVPTKGLRFGSDHIFIFRLNEDHKIAQLHIEWDHADFKRQLGS
ncbi:MAG: nuclear transport factor 2 family protein [Saprospiraceae bacterium]|nr:nuclear transport factor 2 family protein [Saprospiraceae bacterium]